MKMSEYVETEIGEFPKEWEVKKLGEIAQQMYYGLSLAGTDTPTQYKLITTTSINKETFKLDKEKIPFCDLTTYKDKQTKILSKYFVRKGDILISRSGTVGVAILIDKDYDNMLFGSYLIKIKLNPLIDPKFFWYYCQSPLYWQQISPKGATIKNINLQELSSLLIPIPPLEEQKKIVEILQKATDIYYTLKDYIIQIRNSTETIRKVIRRELLTKGIGHNEYVETEIGDSFILSIPKIWKTVKLGSILKKAKLAKTEDPSLPAVGLEDIPSGSVYLTISDVKPKELKKNSKRPKFEKGHILYGKLRPYLDKAAVATFSGKYISSDIYILETTNLVLPEYVVYWLHTDYFLKYVKLKMTKGGEKGDRPRINFDVLSNFRIPLPSLEEQKEIVELLQKADELYIQINDFLQNLEDEANTLYKSILRLAVTGKLTEDWRRQIILLRSIIIPYLVYQASKIKGRPIYITELMKYLFLLQKEYNINLAYNFEPYKYGPFTSQVYRDLESLKDKIEVKEVKDDVEKSLITSKELPQVNQDIANAVKDLLNRFGNKDLKELLSYVYKKYPEYTVRSELNLENFIS